MTNQPTTELNPHKDTLADSDWIEGGGDVNTEMELMRERMGKQPEPMVTPLDGFVVNRG